MCLTWRHLSGNQFSKNQFSFTFRKPAFQKTLQLLKFQAQLLKIHETQHISFSRYVISPLSGGHKALQNHPNKKLCKNCRSNNLSYTHIYYKQLYFCKSLLSKKIIDNAGLIGRKLISEPGFVIQGGCTIQESDIPAIEQALLCLLLPGALKPLKFPQESIQACKLSVMQFFTFIHLFFICQINLSATLMYQSH